MPLVIFIHNNQIRLCLHEEMDVDFIDDRLESTFPLIVTFNFPFYCLKTGIISPDKM